MWMLKRLRAAEIRRFSARGVRLRRYRAVEETETFSNCAGGAQLPLTDWLKSNLKWPQIKKAPGTRNGKLRETTRRYNPQGRVLVNVATSLYKL